MEITCPSGLRGVIRGLKVRELTILTDQKLVRSGRILTEIVKNCWLKTLDAGPYSFGGATPNPLPWVEMLSADRLFVFKEIRIATFGPNFEFEVTCLEELCKHKFLATVDLSGFPVKQLSPESRTHLQMNTPFEVSIGGHQLSFRLMLGKDEERLRYLMADLGLSIITAGYMCRITAIEGVDITDDETFKEWIEDLDYAEGLKLSAAMDKVDASVSTTTTLRCLRCEAEWDINIPLVQTLSTRKKISNVLVKDGKKSSAESSTPSGSTLKSEAQT